MTPLERRTDAHFGADLGDDKAAPGMFAYGIGDPATSLADQIGDEPLPPVVGLHPAGGLMPARANDHARWAGLINASNIARHVIDRYGENAPTGIYYFSDFEQHHHPHVSMIARQRLADAATVDGVLSTLRACGRDALADEVDKLISRLIGEPDEPSPDVKSLKLLARAAFGAGRLGDAPHSIALTEKGYLHAEWHIGQAELYMTFLPTGDTEVVVAHPGDDEDALRVAGTLYSPNTESFAKWLVSSLPK